jgi:1-acyl-sn-glycerol-3-phosphate acyltransferase
MYVGQAYDRWMLFFLGLFWIRVKGKPDPNTRQFCFNHTSIFDGPVIFAKLISTVVVMSGVRSIPVYGRLVASASPLFIDRSSQSGVSHEITDVICDTTRNPVMLAPEAKLSNGDVVFKFRTGGFLSDKQFQPVTIRYYRIFPLAGCTASWLCPSVWEYFWNLLSAPGFVAEVTFLEPLKTEQIKSKSPEERAKTAQLAIANALGTLAIDKSTKDFFQRPKQE